MKKSENPEELYALDDSDLPRMIAHVYIVYSILSGIAFSSVSIQWLFFSFVYCLSALTIFSVPCLILVLSRAQDFVWKSLFAMIIGALFYALVAYGLLKKKGIASVVAVTSSLLTFLADIIFCYILGFRDLVVSAVFVTGIIFNIFLLLSFQNMRRRRRKT
ncbi:MAG: hypothetical protein ACUVRA_06080 [Candidatus Bathyarchaeaceae archaeon]